MASTKRCWSVSANCRRRCPSLGHRRCWFLLFFSACASGTAPPGTAVFRAAKNTSPKVPLMRLPLPPLSLLLRCNKMDDTKIAATLGALTNTFRHSDGCCCCGQQDENGALEVKEGEMPMDVMTVGECGGMLLAGGDDGRRLNHAAIVNERVVGTNE